MFVSVCGSVRLHFWLLGAVWVRLSVRVRVFVCVLLFISVDRAYVIKVLIHEG